MNFVNINKKVLEDEPRRTQRARRWKSGADIYFQERNVDPGSLASLTVGCRVEAEVEQAEKGPLARKVIVYC